MSILKYSGKIVTHEGKILSYQSESLTIYEGDMTVGTLSFFGTTTYGYNPTWAQPGSLNPSNSDISNIMWADSGTQAERIVITFIDNISSLGTIEFDDVEIAFTIDNNMAISANTFPSNPFNDVGEISTVKIGYKLQE
jgi:hypothetical protein